MSTQKKINILNASTPELREKAFSIRKEVFVDEQQVSREEEFDQFEETSHHFVALNEDEEPIGAARWRKTYDGIKLERFAVKKSYRGQKIGSLLVEKVLEDIKVKLGAGQHLYMHAQITAMPLYHKFGFKQVGKQFEECNIKHYKMILNT
ncbi:MAG: GNAT family N-acetyltransferase [Bacteroidota bacterium]